MDSITVIEIDSETIVHEGSDDLFSAEIHVYEHHEVIEVGGETELVEVTGDYITIIPESGGAPFVAEVVEGTVQNVAVEEHIVGQDVVEVFVEGPQGPQGIQGIQGIQGPRGFYVGPTAPTGNPLPATYGWMQTGLPPNGTGMTLWIEDGT